MRKITTDKKVNPSVEVHRELVVSGHGDLSLEERAMMLYLIARDPENCRVLTTDGDKNPSVEIDRELLVSGYGELGAEETCMIAYLIAHEDGSRIEKSKIAKDLWISEGDAEHIFKSLEEKGYLYRNEENWDAQTGPEIIVAERKSLLPSRN
jgi:hypothetical protein